MKGGTRNNHDEVKGGTRNNHDEVKGGTRNNHDEVKGGTRMKTEEGASCLERGPTGLTASSFLALISNYSYIQRPQASLQGYGLLHR